MLRDDRVRVDRNLANAVAAYAARAGLECFVFIPFDLEPAKVASISVFDPNSSLCAALRRREPALLAADRVDAMAFCNINIRPFYAEGSKTLTFETAEQLDWKLPDEIIIRSPAAASSCVTDRRHES